MLELKLQYLGHLIGKANSLKKSLMLGNIEGMRRRGQEAKMVGWHYQLNGHEFEQCWEIVKDKGAWHAAVLEVAELDTT